MSYCWYFTQEDIKERTPSREEGIPLSAESRYRRDGARFVINASNTLGLRYDTMATGVVFFHRFFMVQSFKQFDRWVVGAACLLLAGKVEETPKKCKDILKVTRSLLNDHQMTGFGSNPKEELLTHERILLQTIKFDLQLEHPYSYLLKFAKELKGEKSRIEKLVQMAWTFVNDSLCTTLCLQWEPQAIAVAFLYLAGKLTKFDLQGLSQSKSRSWWRQFVDTLDFHDLESICHQVLDIYGERESEQKKAESAMEEIDSAAAQQQTPPTNMTTASIMPPAGNMAQTTPTQGQLQNMHLQAHRYHTNHHSPSPVPPPTHGVVVAPPTSISSVVQPPQVQAGMNLSSLQPSQVAYVGHQLYTLADPLQALQAMRPSTGTHSLQQAQPQAGASANITAQALAVQQIAVQTTTTRPYSALNVAVGSTASLPRAPMIHQQSFSQLPGQQQQPQRQQQVAYHQTALGSQVLQKSLSMPGTASPHLSALRTGSVGSYQQLAGVGGSGVVTGMQVGVAAQTGTGIGVRTGTGIGIGTGTQLIGSVRTGQPGLSLTTLTPTQQNYATPPPSKRTAYDLSAAGYHASPGVLPTTLNSINQATLATQSLTKLPSLLPPSTISLTNPARVPSLMSQQQSNPLYRTGTPLSVVPSQLPGGGATLSTMTQQLSGRGVNVGAAAAVTRALPGQLHVGSAPGTVPVRSALPQPQPPANARPPTAYGVQQNYGTSTGRGAGWGMR